MIKKLKIIFAGTPQFAVPTLMKISNSFEIMGSIGEHIFYRWN